MRENPTNDADGITFDAAKQTVTLTFPTPYVVDCAQFTDRADLLDWSARLRAKPWMTMNRLRLFVQAVYTVKGWPNPTIKTI